jgi:hypothetical protein
MGSQGMIKSDIKIIHSGRRAGEIIVGPADVGTFFKDDDFIDSDRMRANGTDNRIYLFSERGIRAGDKAV